MYRCRKPSTKDVLFILTALMNVKVDWVKRKENCES